MVMNIQGQNNIEALNYFSSKFQHMSLWRLADLGLRESFCIFSILTMTVLKMSIFYEDTLS